MNTPIEKLELEKENEELKIYMFTVQKGALNVEVEEDFKVVMAYNDNGAAVQVLKDYSPLAPGAQIFVKKRAQVGVKKVLETINVQMPGVPQTVEVKVEEPEPAPLPKTQVFVNNMLLIADRFQTGPQ